MISRVLVPMDSSDHSHKALQYALENYPQAEVTVLHVVGVPSMMMGEAVTLSLDDNITEAASKRAEPIFEQAREIADEVGREIDTLIGLGHPARNIINRADEFDTIVLGAHGDDRGRATHRFLVGNIAETVTKRSPVPVTVVR